MKVKREEDNPLFTLIKVQPWPDKSWAQQVVVIQQKRDNQTGAEINSVRVDYGGGWLAPNIAYEYAQAILRACDIARRLEEEGSILLEGEGEARVAGVALAEARTEDEIAFGKDAWVYCNQHCKPHQTGWCSVSPRDKVGLGVQTAEEAYAKCRAWGFMSD